MTTYDITITSDIVCPWCYIGHTRLSRAIATHQKQYPDDKFNLKYLPFYLNPPRQVTEGSNEPPFPVDSRSRREYYAAKFGPGRAKQMEANMIQVAAGEGLNFKFGGMTGPSRNGHRLVRYAQDHGGEKSQNEVMHGLWKRYFEQEVDITTLDTLVEVGVEAGLGKAEEIRTFLESGDDAKVVDRVADEARMKGISGVPHYEIQDTWEISGAQDPVAFESLFKRWKNMNAKQTAPAAANGNSCL